MSASIKTQCLNCTKQVFLAPADVTLLNHGLSSTYSFVCPLCGAHCVRDASSEVVAKLIGGGVKGAIALPLPRPTIEGVEPTGPPIDIEDLARFHEEIAAL